MPWDGFLRRQHQHLLSILRVLRPWAALRLLNSLSQTLALSYPLSTVALAYDSSSESCCCMCPYSLYNSTHSLNFTYFTRARLTSSHVAISSRVGVSRLPMTPIRMIQLTQLSRCVNSTIFRLQSPITHDVCRAKRDKRQEKISDYVVRLFSNFFLLLSPSYSHTS